MTRVLVTGASGNTGRSLVELLRAHGVFVRAATRSAPRLGAGASGADEDVVFDWMDEGTYDRALEGVERAYLLGPGLTGAVDAVLIPFIRRAIDRGVVRFVLLSASAISEGEPGLGQVHAFLRQNAPQWAVLRPSWFMQNFVDPRHHHAKALLKGQLVTATGAGRVGFVDARDIAAVAARALVDEVPHNAAHVITGPQALAYDDIAASVGRVSGQTIEHRAVREPEVIDHMVENGIPKAYAELLAGLEVDVRRGLHGDTTDVVLRITGRPPRACDAFAREHSAVWRRSPSPTSARARSV